MIELAAGRRLDGLRLMPDFASLKKLIKVCLVRIPLVVGSADVGAEDDGFSDRSPN